jgi:hypothetical protein
MKADEVEALRATIQRLHAEGHRLTEIARLAGCHRHTVYQTLESGAGPDRRRRVWPSRADTLPVAGPSYPGLTEADRAAAATADPDSLNPEISLLRALIHSLESQVSATAGDDQSRLTLIRLIRDLTDSLSRVFRASHALPASSPNTNLDDLGKASELILSQGQTDGTHDAPPAPPASPGA